MENDKTKAECDCKLSDAWRCAIQKGLSTVSCHCPCHRQPILPTQAAEPCFQSICEHCGATPPQEHEPACAVNAPNYVPEPPKAEPDFIRFARLLAKALKAESFAELRCLGIAITQACDHYAITEYGKR